MFCVGPRRPGRDGAGYEFRSGNPLDDYTLYIGHRKTFSPFMTCVRRSFF